MNLLKYEIELESSSKTSPVMLDVNSAKRLASDYFTKKGGSLGHLYELPNEYICVGASIDGSPVIANSYISISKSTGKIKLFKISDKENLKLLKTAKKIL